MTLAPRLGQADLSEYALDGVALGTTLQQLMEQKGKPQDSNGSEYTWVNAAGGTLTVVADPKGSIVAVDVRAGKDEVRELQIPGAVSGATATLGATGHVNYMQPQEAVDDDLCGSLLGQCEAMRLNDGNELIVDFGKDNGMADWYMSEVILGNRNVLARLGVPLNSTVAQAATAPSGIARLTVSVNQTCFSHNEHLDLSIRGRAVDPQASGFETAASGSVSDLAQRKFTLDVAPGAYMYSVAETAMGDRGACTSSQTYVMVLPGHAREQRVTLRNGIADTLPSILVSGTKPQDVAVTSSKLAGNVTCGGVTRRSLDNAGGEITNDPTAYYVDQYVGSESGQEQVLMQLESSRWHGVRWILLMVPHHDAEFNENPAVRRFDLTLSLLQMLGASTENSINCPSPGSQG